ERIPLEQLERELARVMHIELAALLVRARHLLPRQAHRPEAACDDHVEAVISAEEVCTTFAADDDSLPARAQDLLLARGQDLFLARGRDLLLARGQGPLLSRGQEHCAEEPLRAL